MRKSKKTLRNKTKVNSKKKISSRRTKRSSRRTSRKSLRKSKKRTKSKLRMKGGMREETEKKNAFVESAEWAGARPGYVFTTRGGQVGYHVDNEPAVTYTYTPENPKHGSDRQRKLRQEIYEVQKKTLPTIDYLFAESCESKADEDLAKATWIKRFQGKSWKELYREKPIIVIMAHGRLKNRDAFNVPKNTQLIHNERSGNLTYPNVARYENGIYTFYWKDVFETTMNPEREDLYLFEDDGITRKPPFYYNAQVGPNQRKEFSVACQKLYREGDIINNIELNFSDSNGAFGVERTIWNPFNKAPADVQSMTGIYIFNHPEGKTKLQELKELTAIMSEAKSPSADLEKWFTSEAELSNEELADALALCKDEDIEELGDIQIMMEDGTLDNIGFSPPTLAKIKKAIFRVRSLSSLLNLLQREDTNRDYIGDRQNPRHFGFNIQAGITDLKTIMELFGEGTYYTLSCKSSSSSNVEERELERQISKKRQFPPIWSLEG